MWLPGVGGDANMLYYGLSLSLNLLTQLLKLIFATLLGEDQIGVQGHFPTFESGK